VIAWSSENICCAEKIISFLLVNDQD